eukprot:jgi/Chrzof1/11900/Cz06g13310.t1
MWLLSLLPSLQADKGVKCPFCRQYIDQYTSLNRADDAVKRFLQEANKAASIAAAARAAASQQTATSAAPRAPSAQGYASTGTLTDERWNCPTCGTSNYAWRDFCTKCKHTNSSTTIANTQGKKSLLTSLSKQEIIKLLQDKGAHCLHRALLEVGMTCDGFTVSGSNASIQEGVQAHGLGHIIAVIDVLSDSAAIKSVSLHTTGNFAVQRLLEATCRLRGALTGRAAAYLSSFREHYNGLDPYGVLFNSMLPHIYDYCPHEKGTYVVQCATHHCSDDELVQLAQAVFKYAAPLSKDPKGIFVLLKALEQMHERMPMRPAIHQAALDAVACLCNMMMSSDKLLASCAHHALSGHMLVRAISVALPTFPAIKMASQLASHTANLVTSSGGPATVKDLLELKSHDLECSLILRDVCCVVAYSMQGNLTRYVISGEEHHTRFVRALIERMGYEQEVGWVDSIIQELVGVCDALLDKPEGMEVSYHGWMSVLIPSSSNSLGCLAVATA